MNTPFNNKGDQNQELELITLALDGDAKALGKLIDTHKDFVYNIVWRMVLNPMEAEDMTQDILIKVITKLSTFRGESRFSTWLYRIACNHVLSHQKTTMEKAILSFDEYGEQLDALGLAEYGQEAIPSPEEEMVIKDVMFGCTAGMLLCLDRMQRIVYILGDMFEVESGIGAELLMISADNFRQRLSRARKDLYSFMQNKCGLVNKDNPCRCQKKTKQFVELGWVNPDVLQFNANYQETIEAFVENSCDEMDSVLEKSYHQVFVQHPFQKRAHLSSRVKEVLNDTTFKRTFQL